MKITKGNTCNYKNMKCRLTIVVSYIPLQRFFHLWNFKCITKTLFELLSRQNICIISHSYLQSSILKRYIFSIELCPLLKIQDDNSNTLRIMSRTRMMDGQTVTILVYFGYNWEEMHRGMPVEWQAQFNWIYYVRLC